MNKTIITEDFYDNLKKFITNSCFDNRYLIPDNPYKRPIRRQDFDKIDFNVCISYDEIFSNKNLVIHKLLNTIYEQDLLLLDETFNTEEGYKDFRNFYDPEFVALGKMLKPTLEYLAFNFLSEKIEVLGNWNKETFIQYIVNNIKEYEKTESELCVTIKNSSNPTLFAKLLLIQMAPDFLTEASAMGRSLLGSFGEEQSELMKVFIDEYGYGVHTAKHSTLFEEILISAGLNHKIHHYYNDYLPTSLMLGNYFHYLCGNRSNCFKHLGALYYSEAVIPHFNRQVSRLMKNAIEGVDTDYFDEHIHIDMHHKNMVLNKIIIPSINKYGEEIIDDILLGFESFRLLLSLSDQDMIKQIKFIEELNLGQDIQSNQYKCIGEKLNFIEIEDEVTLAHTHPHNELFSVIEGDLIFYASSLNPIVLKDNQKIIIPQGRVHSTIVKTKMVNYSVQSIEPAGEIL